MLSDKEIMDVAKMKSDLDYLPTNKNNPHERVVKPQKCDKKFESFRDMVLEKEKEGKIVVMTFDGYMEADLDEIIKQPTEGLLWDLNRDKLTILSWIDEKKWVNDYATMLVITKLKALLSL